MSLAKQINTCSIILNYTNLNITNQKKIAQKNKIKQINKFYLYTISTSQNIKQNYKCLIG